MKKPDSWLVSDAEQAYQAEMLQLERRRIALLLLPSLIALRIPDVLVTDLALAHADDIIKNTGGHL